METATILTSTVVAAIISATVAAIFQVVVKNKEYRNDYYKKVIEKRIKAAEAVESMLGLFSTTTGVGQENRFMFDFFVKYPWAAAENDVFLTTIQAFAQQSLWLSPTTIRCTQVFVTKIVMLRTAAKKLNVSDDLVNHYLDAHAEVDDLKSKIEQSVADDMATLYDVEAFFDARRFAVSLRELMK